MAMDIDLIYAGHRSKPVTGKVSIQKYLQRSLDAATLKRKLQERDENYQDLAYALENPGKP
jgi:hypothetical protein